MAYVKCRYCGKKIKKDDAYIHSKVHKLRLGPNKGKMAVDDYYFCNQDHYFAWDKVQGQELLKKAELADWRDKFNLLCEEIMGGRTFSYGVFNTKLKRMQTLEGYKKMYSYLEYNKDEVERQLNSIKFDHIYNKLAYLCGILLNNVPEWEEPKEQPKMDISSQFDYMDDAPDPQAETKKKMSKKRNKRRRSMAEIEAEAEGQQPHS